MTQLHKTEDFKGIDYNKTAKSKECRICHCNYFSNNFKSHSKVCKRCHQDIKSFGNFAIITLNRIAYIYFMFDMTEEDVIDFVKRFELDQL